MVQKDLQDAINMISYGFFGLYYPEYPIKNDYFEICSIYLDPICPLFLHSVEFIRGKQPLNDNSSSSSSEEHELRRIEIDLMALKRVSYLNEYTPEVNDRKVKVITLVMNDHKWISYGFVNEKNYQNLKLFLDRFFDVKKCEISRFFGSNVKSSRSMKIITDSTYMPEYPEETLQNVEKYFKLPKSSQNNSPLKKPSKSKKKISFKQLKKTIISLTKKPELSWLFSKHCSNYTPGEDEEKVMTFEEFKKFVNLTQGDNFSNDRIKKIIWNLNIDGDIYGILLGFLNGKNPIKEEEKKNFKEISRRDSVLKSMEHHKLKRSSTIGGKHRKSILKRDELVKKKTRDLANKEENLLNLKSASEIQKGSNLKLSFVDFCNYVFSEDNDILNPLKMKIHEEMKYSLTEYYMNTSHNTYLTGYQIYGTAGIEGYRTAIELGCRSFEIDVWDGKNNQPVVTHGNTLTSKILFSSVIHFLATYAFEISDYPIVISLENHCSEKQQEVIQHCIIDAFGNKVHVPIGKNLTSDYITMEELRNKVILKGRVSDEKYSEQLGKGNSGGGEKKGDGSKKKIHPILESIVSLVTTKEFNMESGSHKILSLSEKKFSALLASKKQELTQTQKPQNPLESTFSLLQTYTKTHFMRVYPSGFRINSSNLNPILAWRAGAQMPALNFQYKDKNMALNYAMFRQNGGVGYVKKRFSKIGKFDNKRFKIKLSVISGQDLMLKKHFGEYFFKVWVNGKKEDEEVNPVYKIVARNGSCHFHPVFQKEKLNIKGKKKKNRVGVLESNQLKNQDEFFSTKNEIEFIISDPNLTFLSFKLKYISKKAKSHLPRVSLPLNSLREGFRVVQFHHKNLALLPNCYLLVKFKLSRVKVLKSLRG